MGDTSDKTQDQSKFKIKVDGQEKEVTKDELIELAQQGNDYTKKTQTLAEERKTLEAEKARVAGLKSIVDEMETDPKLKDTLNKVYSDYKSGKISKSEVVQDRNLKKLDKLIDDTSDPAERERLREIRTIIKEETPDNKDLVDKVAKLEAELSLVRNATITAQSEKIEGSLEKLVEKYGADLVKKYEQDIKATALKYPNQSVAKLLFHFAEDSEIETALLKTAKQKEKEELDRKKRGSSPGGSESSIAVKTPFEKDKRTGRTTIESFKNRVLERLGKK
jgi:uncharacterized protein YdhG (YjbR/CyaY superfamily)